ncbi:MAG TPA: type III pantothenate kinase, partial [Gemmatimonadaceae bacterium]|nr:type III pantothenate kinase [Gemmatimonadaceae bacterium]
MILTIDVGNTEMILGVFEGDTLRAHWRTVTEASRTPDELGLLLRALLQAMPGEAKPVRAVVIASVVPAVTGSLAEASERWLGVTALVIDSLSHLPIRLQVDEPMTVGADRIINTLAASRLYACDTIVVDFGTATTYDCITADGVFLGGIIAPGVRTSAETLIRRTSKLPATELAIPAKAIGTRTEDCIRAGVMFGAADATDGLVRRIKREWPTTSVPRVIATGGLAGTIAPLSEE